MSSTIEQLLEALAHNAVKMEVITLKDGENIEDLIKAKGLKPVGDDCSGCGLHHEYEGPDGEKVYMTPADDEENETEVSPLEEKRQKALKVVRGRQADLLEALDIYKQMEKNIMVPEGKRTTSHQIQELVMLLKLKVLGL